MAFSMNKPVIKGTTKHSALLAKAEEATRTHGVDPTLGAAAMAYGESNSPNVVDYNIKTRKIKWDKENQPKRGPKKPKQGKFNDWLKETVKKAKTKINDSINILKKNTDDGSGENGTNGNGTNGNGTGGNGTGENGTGTVIIDGDGVEMEFTPEQQTAISDDQARLKKSQLDLSIESKPYEYPEPEIDWDSLSEEDKFNFKDVPKRTRENIMKIHKDTDPNAVLAENDPKYKIQATLSMEGGTITGLTSPGPYTHSENEEENYKWIEEGGYRGYIYIDENGDRQPVNPVSVPEEVRVREQTRKGKINRIKTPSHTVTEDGFVKNTTRNKKKLKEDKKTETKTETTKKTDYSNQSLNDLVKERDKKRENNENTTKIQVEINRRLEENKNADWNKKSEEKKVVEKKVEERASQKLSPPAHLRNKYNKLSTYQKKNMRKRYKKYQF